MKREIGVMGIQVGITDDKHDNLMRALSLIEEGFRRYKKIDCICLPELYYSNQTKENRSYIGEQLDSEFFQEFSPVSYTHLDVYKRQIFHQVNQNIVKRRIPPILGR